MSYQRVGEAICQALKEVEVMLEEDDTLFGFIPLEDLKEKLESCLVSPTGIKPPGAFDDMALEDDLDFLDI